MVQHIINLNLFILLKSILIHAVKVIAMRSLFSVALWTCVFLLRQNVANAVECKRMSIQFGIENLHWLTNCTSILGSLTLHSIDDFRGNTEISKFQFPKLK